MSQQRIALSPDLSLLQREGYDLELRKGHLLIKSVPYVNSKGEIKLGTLVSTLDLQGDVTTKPSTHVAQWIGEHPCHSNGSILSKFVHGSGKQDLGDGLVVDHSFSAKADYRDFHHKMTTYIGRITGEAQALKPDATAQTFPVVLPDDDQSVFQYEDTASSRAGIGALNQKLTPARIGIIGLGGTGSFVLDLIAKTPVQEIRLYDGDTLLQHNAFRAPGAVSIEDLRAKLKKVDYYAARYSQLRKQLKPIGEFVDSSNIDQLRDLTFVFLCIDNGSARKMLMKALQGFGIPFIDVGMGIVNTPEGLSGLVRTTSSVGEKRDHVWNGRAPVSDATDPNNEYDKNIQVAELNALNASLAVIRWKKFAGYYRDASKEHYSGYSVANNELVNEENS